MTARVKFPFPYFGHAYAENALLSVIAWFERPPSPRDREAIARELTASHAFHDEPSLDVTWSGNVVAYSLVLDSLQRSVRPGDAPLAGALKKADLRLYGVTKKAMKPVHFGLHLLVDQALEQLHARFPIAFAVREQATRDKHTAWHEWSLTQRAPVLDRIQAFANTSPASFTERRDGFPWIAPWLQATTHVARALTTKPMLATLDAGAKAALGDFFTQVASHAELKPEWAPRLAVASDVREAHEALTALAAKLGGPRKPLSSAEDVLSQIMQEARQFEFTRIKLSDCPTFERVKGDDALRFKVVVLATEKQVRFLEQLSGNRPGSTSLSFSPEQQQELSVREKLIAQLLRRKGTFAPEEAIAMVKVLGSTIRPLAWWLPLELIATRLQEHVKTSGRSPAFTAALEALQAAEFPLQRDEVRGWFTLTS